MATSNLYDLINPLDPEAVERDVVEPLQGIDSGFEAERLRGLYQDVVRLFQGRFPGYRASDAWYHDLEHTNTVFLCTAAMLQGAHYEGLIVSSRGKLLVLACALFHDVGLIRREDETGEGTGARFTVGHEARSIDFMERYFRAHGYDEGDIIDATHIIQCTMLARGIGEIPFRNGETRLLGQILGTADVVAQMADRAYLEKLLLLFREFREAQIPGYGSELELLEKTPSFYDQVVRSRLEKEFDHVDHFLVSHARVRWGVEEEPFHRSIERNLNYLHGILDRDRAHYRNYLRRGGIADRVPPPGAEPRAS